MITKSIGFCSSLRDISSHKLTTMPTIKLGGDRHVVQMDESVITKAKFNVGRVVPQRWIFGIIDTTTHKGILRFVDKRDAETLIPIIQNHVVAGSQVWSDCWAAYRSLSQLGYDHRTVNHSEEFVAADGTCTNAVESYWAKLKRYCRTTDVLKSNLIKEHLDEFMWREEFCRDQPTCQIFVTFLEHLKERYPQ